MRKRAALLAHVQNTHSQYNLPGMGKHIAYKANRDGLAERLPAPAVQKSIAVDLALIGHDDHLLNDVAFSIVHTAKQHDPQTLSRLQSVPGIGTILRLVLLDESHTIDRFPRVQDVVSSCRLVKCAKASAGKRYGTAGAKIGHASLKGAFSAAAGLLLRTHPAGQKSLARFEKKHGQGQALTVLAQQLARAVYSMFRRQTAFAMPMLLQSSSGAERVSPTSHWTLSGYTWIPCSVMLVALRRERPRAQRPFTLRPSLCLAIRSGSRTYSDSRVGVTWAAPPPSLELTGERTPFSCCFA
jgi:hypothetical protein